MGKTLIRCNGIEQHICRKTNTIYMNGSMLLTSEAKDYLRNKGIAIVYGKKPEAPAAPEAPETPEAPSTSAEACEPGTAAAACPAPEPGEMEKIMETVITILRDEYRITDTQTLKDIGLKIITRVNSN